MLPALYLKHTLTPQREAVPTERIALVRPAKVGAGQIVDVKDGGLVWLQYGTVVFILMGIFQVGVCVWLGLQLVAEGITTEVVGGRIAHAIMLALGGVLSVAIGVYRQAGSSSAQLALTVSLLLWNGMTDATLVAIARRSAPAILPCWIDPLVASVVAGVFVDDWNTSVSVLLLVSWLTQAASFTPLLWAVAVGKTLGLVSAFSLLMSKKFARGEGVLACIPPLLSVLLYVELVREGAQRGVCSKYR